MSAVEAADGNSHGHTGTCWVTCRNSYHQLALNEQWNSPTGPISSVIHMASVATHVQHENRTPHSCYTFYSMLTVCFHLVCVALRESYKVSSKSFLMQWFEGKMRIFWFWNCNRNTNISIITQQTYLLCCGLPCQHVFISIATFTVAAMAKECYGLLLNVDKYASAVTSLLLPLT